MLNISESLGQRVRRLRLERALTQVELADLAQVARTTIIRLEQDEPHVRPTTLRRLAKALKVRPTRLTVRTD